MSFHALVARARNFCIVLLQQSTHHATAAATFCTFGTLFKTTNRKTGCSLRAEPVRIERVVDRRGTTSGERTILSRTVAATRGGAGAGSL